jgi:hypothetical protein
MARGSRWRRPDNSAVIASASEAIQNLYDEAIWIASSLQRKIAQQFCRGLLAMTNSCNWDQLLTLPPPLGKAMQRQQGLEQFAADLRQAIAGIRDERDKPGLAQLLQPLVEHGW